ncbi:MAG: hypothetical protein FJX46_11995 [Alphaproteobacteria bacterium]|nr:hypothetical protein [Alphaproteobacteria bacterium]
MNAYLLRLPPTLKSEAERLARAEGTTLNQFIGLAVAERVSAVRTAAFFRERASPRGIEALDRALLRWSGKPPAVEDRLSPDLESAAQADRRELAGRRSSLPAQGRDSGARANRFGRENALRIATALGAEMTDPRSNRARFRGRRVVVKSARRGNTQIGVPVGMLASLDAVLAAFEESDGSYHVYELPAAAFRAAMSASRSKGHVKNPVGLVGRAVFRDRGRPLKRIPAPDR